ncbi:hypothetical protein L6164_002636 [Bauhinia variegata]|uniref:Uncharacterized protein n=1 Tax=Bauhinia variegata TaxID=167791 RepID=A0ACB9Q4A8_BAUVA|nr:hypothetical protein L6164_002636 [Bauhinia variegata]
MSKSYCCVFLFSSLAFLVTLFGAGATPILLGGKTLKIGIPIKTEFKEFVDVKLNSTNQAIQNQVKGYSIDVFFAAVSYLERHSLNVSYEFEAFVNREGNIAGTYDDLLHKIPEKYDAVVGDVTILTNRSTYVDFTLPYAESGVKMLIQVRHRRHLDMWNFLHPFSWDLWLSIFAFCVSIGFVLVFMERNANKEAGMEDSPSRKQPSTRSSILWLPIAQPVLPESTRNGGIAAMFDELPYIKVFLKRHGSKYMMAGPTYPNHGFGFAFPLGSNLTSYFSRAILNVTESSTMDKTEEKYFGDNHDDPQDQFNQISSETPSLTAQSFAGPFIITGSLVLLALLASESHIWKRPVMLAKTFSKKYLFYKSYKKANPSEDGLAIGGDAGSTNQGNNYRKRLPRSLSFPA